jgi:hypothetical protein
VTVGICLPVVYVLSFGPACWIIGRSGSRDLNRLSSKKHFVAWEGPDPLCAPLIYWPMGWAAKNSPPFIGDVVFWYAQAGLGAEKHIVIPTNRAGTSWSDSLTHDRQLLLRELSR